MKNLFKIFILFIIISFIFFIPYAKASSVNMNLSENSIDDENEYYESNNNTNSVNTNEDEDDFSNNNYELDENTYGSTDETNQSLISVDRTSSESNNELTLSDLLSIVIIVIGIILVALGIAILIRCK